MRRCSPRVVTGWSHSRALRHIVGAICRTQVHLWPLNALVDEVLAAKEIVSGCSAALL
jgi:hypothetical protein